MSELVEIIVRDMNDEDLGLIYSATPKGIYWGSPKRPKGPKKKWFQTFFNDLKLILPKAEVRVACAADDFAFVLGYAIILDETLFFVYVKESFRLQGIARLLCENRFKYITNVTRIGRKIAEKHQLTEIYNGPH